MIGIVIKLAIITASILNNQYLVESYEPPPTVDTYSTYTYNLASIIEGEAPIEDCGFDGQLAVAHVYSRNQTMYGYRTPSETALYIAENWANYNDPTNGSIFIVNTTDLDNPLVRDMTGYPDSKYRIFECGITDLYVFPQR